MARAQTGAIGGFVYDFNGKPSPNIKIIAYLSTGTYFGQSDISDDDGKYLITDLPVGYYFVRVYNSPGYVNKFYNDALSQSEATKVKVDLNKTTDNINFYLDKGGFIKGHIYTKADSTVISSGMIVAFTDYQSKTFMGNVTSDKDGYYISPALSSGEYAISAGNSEQGYIISYYNNIF